MYTFYIGPKDKIYYNKYKSGISVYSIPDNFYYDENFITSSINNIPTKYSVL